MTGRYTGTRGDADWTPCWECKRTHDEHHSEPAGAGDGLTCPVTAAELDPDVCRRLAAWAAGRDFDELSDQLTAAAEMAERYESFEGRHTCDVRMIADANEELAMLRAQLAERPALTADEVRAVVRDVAESVLCSKGFHAALGVQHGPIIAAIAHRVAEQLAGRVLTSNGATP